MAIWGGSVFNVYGLSHFLQYIVNLAHDPPIYWDQEMSLCNQNYLKSIVQRSCTENMEYPDDFVSTPLGSPSGTVYNKFKLFEIVANLS